MSISCRDVSYKYIHSHLHQVYPSFTYTPSNPPKCFHLGHEMFLYNMPLERLGRGGSLCKLFQHLGKLYLDYLGKLYLDYLCWMTMIDLILILNSSWEDSVFIPTQCDNSQREKQAHSLEFVFSFLLNCKYLFTLKILSFWQSIR